MLKESSRAWYRETDSGRAEEMLGLLEEKMASDSLYEFKKLLHTFTNWREEILNYFDYRVTSSFVRERITELRP